MSDTHIRVTVSVKRGEATVKGEVPVAAFASAEELALKELGRELSAPGFRKGHLPLEVLRKQLPDDEVLGLAARLALETAYRDIVRENELRPITPPQVTITKIARGNPLGFSMRVGVFPAVKLPDYKKLATSAKGRDELTEELLKHAHIELADLVLDLEMERIRHELIHALDAKNESLAGYFEKMKKTEEAFFTGQREHITRDLKRQILMEAIAEAEHLIPTAQSVAAHAAHLHEHHPSVPPGRPEEYVRLLLRDEAVFHLLLGARQNATSDTGHAPDELPATK